MSRGEAISFQAAATTTTTIYLGTDSTSPEGSSVIGGVQKSTDGGVTWNVIGLANQDVSLLAIDVRVLAIMRGAAPTVYADTPGGVFKIAGSD